MAGLLQFWKELRRRNVVKVGIAYGALAWLLLEIASTVLPILDAPEWVLRNLLYVLAAGLPLALIIAWIYELTPEGVKRAAEIDEAETPPVSEARFNAFVIVALLAALTYFLVDEFFIEPASQIGRYDGTDKSIAVLPFDNRSALQEDEYFVDGIHDDILTQLAHIGALKVISRTSVLEYRDTTKNMRTIGEELGVATILEGGVQRAGDHIRINMQLIDAATDEHLWAQTYDRELTAANIFAIQTEIATTVATALRAALTTVERDRINMIPTENLEAYESYLLGKQQVASRTLEAFEAAKPLFERAIELDPDFALAYVGLADARQLLFGYTGGYRFELLDEAELALEKALDLDSTLGEAYASLGLLHDYREEYGAAREYLERSIDLAPNYVHGYRWYAAVLDKLDRHDEAFEQIKISVALDPFNMIANWNYVDNLAARGRYDEAFAVTEKISKARPDYGWPHRLNEFIHSNFTFRYDLAAIEYKKVLTKDPNTPFAVGSLGWNYLILGDADAADYWINRGLTMSPDSYWGIASLAFLNLYRGDTQKAVELAQKAIEGNPVQMITSYKLLANQALAAGDNDAAIALYEPQFGDLLTNPEPEIHHNNFEVAIDIAVVLKAAGQRTQMERLLSGISRHIGKEENQRQGGFGFGISDVYALALQGKKEQALAALRDGIDSGWKQNTFFLRTHQPALESIRDDPRFLAMMDEIDAALAEQLANLNRLSPDPQSLEIID